MPIYEYQCQACHHQFETIQKLSDPVLTDCPQCEAPQLKKLLSLSAFRLKGSGWYETDFKSGSRKNVAGDSKSGESGSSGESKSGGEAPAASSAESKSESKADNAKPKQSTDGGKSSKLPPKSKDA